MRHLEVQNLSYLEYVTTTTRRRTTRTTTTTFKLIERDARVENSYIFTHQTLNKTPISDEIITASIEFESCCSSFWDTFQKCGILLQLLYKVPDGALTQHLSGHEK